MALPAFTFYCRFAADVPQCPLLCAASGSPPSARQAAWVKQCTNGANMNKPDDKKDLLKKAAALSYQHGQDAAPKLSAKGKGVIAEKIIALAQEHHIPLHQDADLVEILDKVELEQEIPLEVYAVVAEIFAYIYKVNQQRAQR
jgi:flagellar biosynthesis protein